MRPGRPKEYQTPVTVTLKCEKDLREVMIGLKVGDTEVYKHGAIAIAKERAGELTDEQLSVIIQAHRRIIKESQEAIMLFERLAIDAKVREQARRKSKQETRYDDRGQPYTVVEAP